MEPELTEEEMRQSAEDIRDELELMESSARIVIIQLEAFIEGEITHDQYVDWLNEHKHLTENLAL